MTPKELEQTIRSLLKQPLADAALREQLEKLATVEISFSGFTWLFGPELYRRNRILFRPFILSRFSTYMVLPKFRSEQIRWKGDKGVILESWLDQADKNDDADLFRRLYKWKLETKHNWQLRDKRSEEITHRLLSRYRSADTTGKRIVSEEGFVLNAEKTRLMGQGNRQTVTGVVVNRTLGLSRSERRRMRATLHQLQQSQTPPEAGLPRRIEGKLAYLARLNPGQAERLRA
jgi:hypothetical protein